METRLAVADGRVECGTDFSVMPYCIVDGRRLEVLDKDFNNYVFRCLRPAELNKKIADCTAAIDKEQVSDREKVFVYSERADAYLEAGDFNRSVSDFDVLIKLAPTPALLSKRGDAHFKKGDYKLALADYSEAMKGDIKNPQHQVARSLAYSALKEWDSAIADLKGAIRLDPDRLRYYELLGSAYMDAEKYPEAVETYSKLIEMKKDSDSYLSRALAYFLLRDDDSVIADASIVIEMAPSGADAWAIRGLAYFRRSQSRLLPYLATRDCSQSVEDLSEAIRLGLEEIAFYDARANSYQCLGKTSEAADDWRRILELDPRNEDALASLARLEAD